MNSFFRQALGEELLGFVVEVVELALDDRDDVAGDVRVGLRVLQSADPPFALLLLVLRYGELHGEKIAKPDRDSGIYLLAKPEALFRACSTAAASPDSAT